MFLVFPIWMDDTAGLAAFIGHNVLLQLQQRVWLKTPKGHIYLLSDHLFPILQQREEGRYAILLVALV